MGISKLFVIYLIIAVVLRLFLWAEIRYIFGTDVGRFAEISHIFYLKGQITPDLRPYNMAYGFFYFLLPILIPTALEYASIDPVITMTALVFIFSILSCIVFYFIMKQFFDERKSAHMFFFYSIAFDIILIFGIAGIYSYALSVLWFFLSIYFINKIFFDGSKSWLNLGLVLALFSVTHIYLLIPLLCYCFALITYEIVKENSIKRTLFSIKQVLKSLIFPILINIPIIFIFGNYIGLQNDPINKGLMLAVSGYRESMNIYDRLYNIFFSSYTLMSSIIFMAGLLFFIVSIYKFRGRQFVWVFYSIYLFVHNIMAFNDTNLTRVISVVWMTYAIGFGNLLIIPFLNVGLIPLLYFVPSTTVPYYINVLEQKNVINENIYPWVLWDDFYKSIDYIKQNTAKDSIFLLDSGGAGCFGSSSSYGDRIFPLTSRKPFYFTDYCWAVWDYADYEKRVDIYRGISINPNNFTILQELKTYNVTHVFIGPYDVGLNYGLFDNSSYYEEVYNDRGFAIFEIK